MNTTLKFGNRKSLSLGLGLLAITALGITSCSAGTTTTPSPTTEAPMTTSAPASTEAMDGEGLVGAGCAAYAAAVPSGAGSVAGMAADPVATAASNNPLLKTLTAAVSGQLNKDVNLVDTLNSGEFTVFAPVDDAFAKIPAETIEGLKTDSATLTSILTYHVVPGQLAPSKIAGEHATAEGSNLEVTGTGDNLEVNGAKVICGGVKTANATVYLIDTVLMPPAKK
ncbi:putative surface protein with fasciclin (FAS1) repeats [Arthrobacter stackebrandtii]|uniref:Surface protein with fasciclin (FAS1) repeats n=1 Tax=Arthrobacter stackebrandtii TaxID=272161 RepID=A0ABS4YTR7_9MICC|nr:fasciclin domain-containing protein [Arthrobacter stackebrandtii]MBP2412192.1 putative surface protein with fasciclin (FAS1) repeats [Arthrobacter stackebrandtii]PYH01983.1 fasciclin [Arthrobacter stackebrandtii]